MLLPRCLLVLYNHWLLNICYGRCYCQVADGIATVDWNVGRYNCHVADGIATVDWNVGRCYCHVADGIATAGLAGKGGREEQNLMRAIKEALYIRVNNPSLNRNIGKYHLPHIWDEVLFNTSELKLKWTRPSGYSICHMAITCANISICSGYSICHLAITSAITYI